MGYECLGQEIKSFPKDTLTTSYMSGTELGSGEVWLSYDSSKENRKRERKMEFLESSSILNKNFTMCIIFLKIIVFLYSLVPQGISHASYIVFRLLQITESKSTLILGSLNKNQ